MLDSYINKSILTNITTEITPEYINSNDINLISEYPYCSSPYNNSNSGLSIEFHVYTPAGNYLKSIYNCDYSIRTNQLSDINVKDAILRTSTTLERSVNNNPVQCKVLLDINKLIQRAGYYTGQFNVLTNIFVDLIGSNKGVRLYVDEISTDRTEVKLAFTNSSSDTLIAQFNDADKCISDELSNNRFSTYLLNFGHNIVYQIVNFYFEVYAGQYYVYLKLYKPLSNNIKVKNTCWVVEEVAKPSLFPIRILQQSLQEQYNTLRGPNFDIDISNDFTATDYKTWDDLIGTDTISNDSLISPTQQILNSYFSGSLGGIELNINYRYFKNFVHFSSAEQRVKNFIFKLRQINWYDSQIEKQGNILAASNTSTVTNIESLKIKRENIISLFDDFEKYLYFEPSSTSLYSNYNESDYYIYPYPKYDSGTLYPMPDDSIPRSTDDAVIEYLNDLIDNAKNYDKQNVHALINTVPQFIRLDENNDQYELFIYMIGQYYDVLWSYINSLHDINVREENPFDGMPNDLLWHVAQSLGMKLYNGWQDTDLHNYELKNNKLFSKKQNTYSIWRRILNNLPYLYKLKGTKQCIYALMSCFGLPNTFLTIKEYGGPTSNALNRNNNDITYHKDINIGSLCTYKVRNIGQNPTMDTPLYIPTLYNIDENRYMYIEFQLRTDSNYKYDNDTLSILKLCRGDNDTDTILDLNLKLISIQSHEFSLCASIYERETITDILNLKFNDDDWYTVLIGPISTSAYPVITNIISCKQKYGNIIDRQENAIDFNTVGSDIDLSDTYIRIASEKTHPLQLRQLRIWNTNIDDINRINIQNHTLNPNAYDNMLEDSYNLIVYPFDKQHASISDNTVYVSSSVVIPNKLSITPCSFKTHLSIDDCFENNNEVAYIKTPSLGNDTIYNTKIRIETNYIPVDTETGIRVLSNSRRNESSSFDNYSLDSNVVGIYYSPTDQLNNDIYNQLGYWNLDDYIGDPSDVWKSKYTSLNDMYNKYISTIDSFDLHSYFNILCEYDFTIFKYIENMIPMRCDLIDGVVIEQSILERSKFTIGKENHQIKNNSYSSSVDLLNHYEISAPHSNIPIICITSSYATFTGTVLGNDATMVLLKNNHNLMKLSNNDTIKNRYTKYNTLNYTSTYTYSPISITVSSSRCDNKTINANWGKTYHNNTITDNSKVNGCAYYWNGASNFDYENTKTPAAIKYGKLQGINLDTSIRVKNLKFKGCKVTQNNNVSNLSELPLNNWQSPIQITYVNDNTIITNTAGQTVNKYNRVSAVNNVLRASNILNTTIF